MLLTNNWLQRIAQALGGQSQSTPELRKTSGLHIKQSTWVFLFPESERPDGGYLAQQLFAGTAKNLVADVKTVAYQPGNINSILGTRAGVPPALDTNVYCIHFGPQIQQLLKVLRGRRIIYFAHSTGWKINLPPSVPVLCVSKHCMAYWAKKSPSNPVFYLPNIIDQKFSLPADRYADRPTDILVFRRKMSSYLMDDLVPRLALNHEVKVIDSWTETPEQEMQRAKIFLYDSSSYWRTHKASEGFGLPPLEAIACGCGVFSSLNDGLSDFLDTVDNCNQLMNGKPELDCQRIAKALKNWQPATTHAESTAPFRKEAVGVRLGKIIESIDELGFSSH